MQSDIDKLGSSPTRLKRSQASLFGGVACGIAVCILVVLLAGPSPAGVVLGLVIGAALGAWVRLADL